MNVYDAIGELNRQLMLVGDVCDEHSRWATYQAALEAETLGHGPVGDLLRAAVADEPDPNLALSVVLRILEQIPDEQHQPWFSLLPDRERRYAADRSADLRTARHLSDLEKEITAADLTVEDWSDWLQRRVSEQSGHRVVLEQLSTAGRIKRVRNTARERSRTLPPT